MLACLRVFSPKLLPLQLIRNLCVPAASKKNEFQTVYKFPYIRAFSVANKLKLYQTVLTGITVPFTSFLYLFNDYSVDLVYCAGALGIAGIVPLYGLGFFTNKLVGFIYYNEKERLAKIAYSDFWGRRKDCVIPVKDIVPFSEISYSVTDVAYLKVKQFSNNDTKKICVRLGIEDPQKFNKIFNA